MTTNFRGGVFSSLKPYIGLPEALENPMHQKYSPIQLEMSIPSKNGTNHLFQGQISPELAGTPKQSITGPQGLFGDKITNTNKEVKKYEFTKVIIDVPPLLEEQKYQKIRKKEEIRETTSPQRKKMKVQVLVQKFREIQTKM
jgi:hypothetical protein